MLVKGRKEPHSDLQAKNDPSKQNMFFSCPILVIDSVPATIIVCCCVSFCVQRWTLELHGSTSACLSFSVIWNRSFLSSHWDAFCVLDVIPSSGITIGAYTSLEETVCPQPGRGAQCSSVFQWPRATCRRAGHREFFLFHLRYASFHFFPPHFTFPNL